MTLEEYRLDGIDKAEEATDYGDTCLNLWVFVVVFVCFLCFILFS